MVLRDDPPGTAFAFCVVAYAVVRSVLEFARGDAERRWWLGVSVPQLQGLASSCVVVVLESAGHLPHSRIHTAAAGLLVVVLAIARRPVAHPALCRAQRPASSGGCVGTCRDAGRQRHTDPGTDVAGRDAVEESLPRWGPATQRPATAR